jgi:hypothetical protein
MSPNTKQQATNFVVGAVGGAAMAFGAWMFVRYMLNRQFATGAAEFVSIGQRELQNTLDNEIPQRVRETIDQKFREVGITRDTGRQINSLLTSLEGMGILQTGQR